MKTRSFKKCKRVGLVTILSTVVVGSFLLAIMGIMYRGSIRSLEAQKKVQLQVDYDAKKQAFLRAVVTLAPVSVANTMISGATSSFEGNLGLFDLASTASKFEMARTPADEALITGFLATYKNGNTGDRTGVFDVANYVGMVSTATAPVLVDQVAGVDVVFEVIDYPDIHFGYYSLDDAGDKKFIAKKRSWEINVHELAADIDAAGLSDDLLNDNYRLDIYEIPAQLAISSSAFTNVGQIGAGAYDATYSDNITIEGNIYAKKATLSHDRNIDGISTSKGASLTGSATVADYDATATGVVGARTTHENANAAFYPISKASDFARTLFLPINTGFDFFDRFATSDGNGNPTEDWYTYSCGSHQCKMKLDIIEVISGEPSAIRFTIDGNEEVFYNSNSSLFGTAWPEDGDADYDTFPFLPETSSGATSVDGVAIHLGKLATWIENSGYDADDYNSIAINANYNEISNTPGIPTETNSPHVVILRDSGDLTAFSEGFSIVTNYTLQILEDLNQTPKTAGGTDFPPLSIFAPTIHYGESDINRTVNLTGSLGSLNTGTDEINVLELKDSSDGASASQIFADLKPIEKIADLPPINVMNWLVVIKKAD